MTLNFVTEETTDAPTARFRFKGDGSDTQTAFSDLTAGAGVDLDNSVDGYSYAADYASATTQLQFASADVTTINAYTAFTVSFWAKISFDQVMYSQTDASSTQYNGLWIWARPGSNDFRILARTSAANYMAFSLGVNVGNASTNPFYTGDSSWDGEWHHIVVSSDATGHNIVVDGIDITSLGTYITGSQATDISPAVIDGLSGVDVDTISIGAASWASNPNNRLTDGAISDVRIWNTKMSVVDAQSLYAETLPRYLVIGSFGQSNSSGYNDLDGGYDQSASGADAGNRRVLQWGRGYTGATATGTYNPSFQAIADGAIGPALDPLHNHEGGHDGIGPMLTFAKGILSNVPDNYSILIVPSGHGATGFSTDVDSDGGTNDWLQGGVYYEDAKDRYVAAMATNSTYNIAGGFVWNQRESDANVGEAPNYETHLGDFVDNMRSDIGEGDILIMMSGPSDEWLEDDSNGYKATVSQATISVCNSKTNCRYVSTAGLDSEYDKVQAGGTSALSGDSLQKTHLSADAQRAIGEKYANTFLAPLCWNSWRGW